MSKRLEEFIIANKQEFEELEPSEALWARIEMHLPPRFNPVAQKQAKMFSLGFVLRVAATIVVVMGVGFGLYLGNTKKQGIDFSAINPEYARQHNQYASLIATKRSELKSIAHYNEQLYSEFTSEIARMDSTYKQMNNDLLNSPNQERVLKAMIRNLQIQTQVLNQQLQVIEQFKEMKDEQKNESKNI